MQIKLKRSGKIAIAVWMVLSPITSFCYANETVSIDDIIKNSESISVVKTTELIYVSCNKEQYLRYEGIVVDSIVSANKGEKFDFGISKEKMVHDKYLVFVSDKFYVNVDRRLYDEFKVSPQDLNFPSNNDNANCSNNNDIIAFNAYDFTNPETNEKFSFVVSSNIFTFPKELLKNQPKFFQKIKSVYTGSQVIEKEKFEKYIKRVMDSN